MSPLSVVFKAFTLIELLIVITIMVILFSIGAGAILGVMAQARVDTATEALSRVHHEARRRAMIAKPQLTQALHLYGVALYPAMDGEPGAVVLLNYDPAKSSYVVYADQDGNGRPDTPHPTRDAYTPDPQTRALMAIPIPQGVVLDAGFEGAPAEPLTRPLVWWYAWGSGVPVAFPGSSCAIGVGTPGKPAEARETMVMPNDDREVVVVPHPQIPCSPVCSELVFRQGQRRVQTGIYPLGTVSKERL